MNDYPYQQQPSYPQPPYAPSTSGMAVASLVMSILGLTVIPTIGSLIGLLLGYAARSEIDQSGGRIGGRELATWGIILGWVGVAFMVIGICIAVLVITGFVALPIGFGICAQTGNYPGY